ncbi:hypothetical protein ABW636_04175 [Aquimarina sp. 2201CG1-2-11]|uniref:hypothetical protein n=1 Tax=Aquimarina discodermiae TaxID=3231043 RepID=UPI0034625D5C
MKYVLYIPTILVFIVYWGFTGVFVAPDNYINISLLEESKVFNTFLFQKWGFFAPPPKSNDRLYYNFTSKNDCIKAYTFEVMEPLVKQKSRKAPFNSSEDLLDYVLSNTINSICDGLFLVNESIKDIEEVEKISLTENQKIEKGKVYVQSTNEYKTLQNYAFYVATKNGLDPDNFYVDIQMSKVDLPKFIDRQKLSMTDSLTINESIIFESDKFTIDEKFN